MSFLIVDTRLNSEVPRICLRGIQPRPERPSEILRTKLKSSVNFLQYFQRRFIRLGLIICGVSAMAAAGTISGELRREAPIRFHRLNSGDGLSQNFVYCFVQDRQGFMWFGTLGGLNRFDGYGFTTFLHDRNDPRSISDNTVQALFVDSRGTLWIGTMGGLNKFDGDSGSFVRYLNEPEPDASPNSIYVTAIAEAPSGMLLIGTRAGLCLFDPIAGKLVKRYTADARNSDGLSSIRIKAIIRDRRDCFWIGTGDGLDRFDPATEKFVHFRNDPNDPRSLSADRIQALWEDRRGNLWIGTWTGGLNKYDPTTGIFTRYQHDPGNPSSLSDNQVEAVVEDDQGRIWVGTWANGLNCLVPGPVPDGERFIHYQSEPNSPNGLGGNSIVYFYQDRQKNLWIGHSDSGLSRIDASTKPFHIFQNNPLDQNSLGSNSVDCLYEDRQGILWIGTNGSGLDRFDRQQNRFTHFIHDPADPSSLSHNGVLSIHEDPDRPDQILWIGTTQGLNRFDKSARRFKPILFNPSIPKSVENIVYNIQKGDGRILWMGTAAGLVRFDTATENFVRYAHDPKDPSSLSENSNESLLMDKSGNLWIGTYSKGLNVLLKGQEKLIRYSSDPQNPAGLSSGMINSIFEDKAGHIWIGTNRGLNLLDPKTGRFSLIPQKEGLTSPMIGSIQEDDSGNLWIVMAKGLSRFNPAALTYKNFDEKDGLPSNELNLRFAYKGRSGEFFFGTTKGFFAFNPAEIQENPYLPPVVITDLKLFNESVPVGPGKDGRTILEKSISSTASLELTHRDYIVGFEFAALNYTLPEKNQYAYKIEGFDKDWNYVGNRRFAAYSNLPPGNFVFRVKASNNDGLWNEEGASLGLKVIPPFWKTWWFKMLLVLSGLAVIGAVFEFRTRAIKRRNILLENEVNLRTQELKEMSLADPLTGLRNRRFLQEILTTDISAFLKLKKFAQESRDRRISPDNQRAVYGIFMFDLDHFKTVNDAFGHESGDSVLKKFAQILRSSVREDDPVIRYGGEEFLVILKKTQPEYLDVFAKRILDKIREAEYRMTGDVPIKENCSLGYTMFPFYDKAMEMFSFAQTITIADQGLYYAKTHGRNCAVKVFPREDAPTSPGDAQNVVVSLDDVMKKDIVSIHIVN